MVEWLYRSARREARQPRTLNEIVLRFAVWVRLSSVLSKIVYSIILLGDLWCITPSLHASNGPNDSHNPFLGCMAIDNVGLRGPLVPTMKGTCAIIQKNPHLYIYFLTTSLPVATKMILSNPFRLWDPPSCVEYRWPIHPSSITPYFLSKQWHNKVW